MKIYVSHSRDFNFEEELYNPLRESALKEGNTFFFPHENGEKNTKEEIKNSDLVLAEVSFPSTGQGIEIGWANMLQIPILCISKEGCAKSSSLDYITKDFIVYSDSKDFVSKLSGFLGQ